MMAYQDMAGPERQLLATISQPENRLHFFRGNRESRPPAERLSDLAEKVERRLTGQPSLVFTPYEGIGLLTELSTLTREVLELQQAVSAPRGLRARLAAFIRRQ